MSTNGGRNGQGAAVGLRGYSAKEVAASLGCSEKHIKNLMKLGDIPSVKLGQRRIILDSDLRKALEARVQNGWSSKESSEAA